MGQMLLQDNDQKPSQPAIPVKSSRLTHRLSRWLDHAVHKSSNDQAPLDINPVSCPDVSINRTWYMKRLNELIRLLAFEHKHHVPSSSDAIITLKKNCPVAVEKPSLACIWQFPFDAMFQLEQPLDPKSDALPQLFWPDVDKIMAEMKPVVDIEFPLRPIMSDSEDSDTETTPSP